MILRPATVYGPRSKEVVGEIARAMRSGNMLLVDRGRAVAGLCYVDNLMDAAVLALATKPHRARRSTSATASTSPGGSSPTTSPTGWAASEVRWSMPYWMASGIGFSLEHGYRALRRTTRLSTPPLLSRQAVHVLGRDQDFSIRKAREMLGWEPRVDYASGMRGDRRLAEQRLPRTD